MKLTQITYHVDLDQAVIAEKKKAGYTDQDIHNDLFRQGLKSIFIRDYYVVEVK